MGDPKRFRKKYETPVHPWSKVRIDAEKELSKEYGLTNKKEIFKAQTFLKKYKNIAKRLTADTSKQGEKETAQVLTKLQNLGLLPANAQLDQILNLQEKDVLERRLQSIVCRKSLARSMKQARQFITHRHIIVDGKEITSPSYLVTVKEESSIVFKEKSALASEDHPERAAPTVSKSEDTTQKEAPAAEEVSLGEEVAAELDDTDEE